MNAFCASANFDTFMCFRFAPSQESLTENSSLKRSGFQGAEKWICSKLARNRNFNFKMLRDRRLTQVLEATEFLEAGKHCLVGHTAR